MQENKVTQITRDEVVPLAERMKKAGRYLVMIHGWLDKDGQPVVSWDYSVPPAVECYRVVGETKLPSIGEIAYPWERAYAACSESQTETPCAGSSPGKVSVPFGGVFSPPRTFAGTVSRGVIR